MKLFDSPERRIFEQKPTQNHPHFHRDVTRTRTHVMQSEWLRVCVEHARGPKCVLGGRYASRSRVSSFRTYSDGLSRDYLTFRKLNGDE